MVAAASLSVGLAPRARAANFFWDTNSSAAGLGGTGNWDTATANWFNAGSATTASGTDTTAAAAFTTSDVAYFTGTAGTVTLGSAITVNGLNFGADNYVITGLTANPLTFDGTTPTITLQTGVTNATVTALISGSAGLTFNGGTSAGTLTLGATAQVNNYTGTTNISSGTLRVTSITALGASGAGNGTVVNTGGALRIGIGGTIATELLTLNGAGVSSGGALVLDQNLASTWSGAITIGATGATVNVGSGSTFTQGTAQMVVNGALTKTGNGLFALTALRSTGTGTLSVDGGTFRIASAGAGVGWDSGNITVNSGGTLQTTGGGTNSIINTGTITVNSGGMVDWQQTGAETIGGMTINGTGINNAGALGQTTAQTGGAITGAVTLGGNSTIGVASGGRIALATAIANPSFTLTKDGAGELRSTVTGSTPFGARSIVLNGGTLALVAGAASAGTGASTNGDTFTYGGTGAGGGGTITLTRNSGTNGVTYTVGNAASGTVLTRSSRGTLVLNPTTSLANLGVAAASGGERFIVLGTTLPANVNTIADASIVAMSGGVGSFVNYSGTTNGFTTTGVTYAAAVNASTIAVNTISDVTSSVAINTGSNPYALRVGNFTLTNSGTTTVNGTGGTAGVILNSGTTAVTNDSVITGGTLAFGSSEGTIFAVTVPSGAGIGRISSAITGTAGITKFGPGALTLNGNNSGLSGAVQLNQGTLNLNSANAIGTGSFTIKDGTTINNNSAAAITLSTNNTQTWDGNFTFTGTQALNLGTGAVTMNNSRTITASASTLTVGGPITGAGTLTKAGAGALTLSGSNTGLTGGVTLSAGTLNINNANALGTSAGAFTITAASTINNTSGAAITNAGNNPVNIASTGALTLTFTGSQALHLGTGAVTLGGGTLTLANAGAFGLTLGGNVGDNAQNTGITKTATGVVTLSGTGHTFTGPITVSAGTLSLGSIADGVTYGAGVGNIVFDGTAAARQLIYTGGNATITNRRLNLDTITIGTVTLNASGSGAINFANTTALGGTSGTKPLVLRGTNTGLNTLAAVINDGAAGTRTLTKLERGQWVLTNNNTYTGATTVQAGTLTLDFTNTPVKTNIIANTSALTLGGGTLNLVGHSTATAQTFASTALTAGTMSTITAAGGGGTLGLNLGAVTRNLSSALNINLSGSPLPTVTASSGLADVNGIIASTATGAAFVTANGTDWASAVTGTPTYSNDTYGATLNTNITTGASPATFVTNTLRFNTGSPTLTLTGANRLAAGGLLVGSGAGAVTIGGAGSLTGTNVSTTSINELNIFQNSASALTISAPLLNNATGLSYVPGTPLGAATALSVFGTGTTILSSTSNAYTGGTNISGSATLQLGASQVIPGTLLTNAAQGGLNITGGGTLDLNGFNQIVTSFNGGAGAVVTNTAVGASSLTIGNVGGTGTYSGVITNSGGALSLVKSGSGSITLNNQNTYTGTTTISQGTLLLNFTNVPLQVTNNLLPTTALTIGSGTLSITGSTTVNAQSFSGTTLAGGATITTAGTAPAVTLNLGAITRAAGTTLAVNLGIGPTGSTTTTLANTGTSILGGWAVQGQTVPTTWAVSAGNGSTAGAITGLATFLTTTTAGNTAANYLTTSDVDVTNSPPTLTGAITINSLRFNTAGANTVTLTGVNTINTGGILVTATVGNNNQTISGGDLQGPNGGELIIHNYNTNTNRTITINSRIIANAASGALEGLTINAGTGTVALRTATNTYAGQTVINSGTLNVDRADRINSSSGLTLNGGTLRWDVNDAQPLALTLGAAGGALNVSGNDATRNISASTAVAFIGAGPRTLTINGAVDSRIWSLPAILGDAAAGSPTSLVVSLGGDIRFFRLAAANTYTGITNINRGILDLNVNNAISSGLLSTATTGNIVFTSENRAILQTNATAGTITRSLGYGPGQIHWEGNGGFSNGSAATQVVNLGGAGATLTWGAGGFVPTGSSLLFGHGGSINNQVSHSGSIDFQNSIDLGTASRTVDVATTDVSAAMFPAILSGNLTSSAGGGVAKTGTGALFLSGSNSGGPATVSVIGGLVFEDAAAIPGTGANITFNNAVTNGAVGVIGDTNPIATLGGRIANPSASTTTGAFLLGADSSTALDFANFPNMRLAAFQFTPGATPTGPALATTYTGTITPAGGTYRFGGIIALGQTADKIAATTLVLPVKNQLTGSNAVNITYGQTTITGSNNYTGATTFNGNAIAQVRVGIGSNTAFGTSAVTLAGTQTVHFGMVNGDRTLSNNISFDGASTLAWEASADPGTGGILRNTSQGAISYLGTVNLGGRSNPNIVGRPGGTLFFGDITGGAGGINYTQGAGGYFSWLSTSANAGVAKTYTGNTSLGDNAVLVIDSASSVSAGNFLPNSSAIQLHPGTTSIDLGTRAWTVNSPDTLIFNTPSGSTLTTAGVISAATTGGLNKQGLGLAILQGLSPSAVTTGTLTVSAGTLRLDAATAGGTIWGAAAQPLVLGQASGTYSNGGTLEITGTSAQSFAGVTINARANNINLTDAMTLTVGTITRTAGSTLNFSAPTGAVASAHAAVAGLVNGATTWNGNDWAAANGANISQFTAYTALTGTASAPTITSGGTLNYIVSSATTNNVTLAATGTINANTLKYSDTTNRTIDIRNVTTQGTLRLGANTGTGSVTTVGGLLVASGAGALTIGVAGTPGTLTAGGTTANAAGDLVFINNSSSDITVNAVIANNGTTAIPVAYDGRSTGKLILAGANTFGGAIIINRGVLEVATVNSAAAAGPLGQGTAAAGNILLNGGTFRANLSANGTTNKGFTVNAPSTIDVVANTLTINSTALGVATSDRNHLGILNAGILTKTGAGTLDLRNLTTAANNANLSILVSQGTLLLNQASTAAISAIDLPGSAGLIIDAGATARLGATGTGGNQISNASSVVVKSTGVFDLAGKSETIDGLAGDGIVQANGTSTLTVGGNNSAGISAYTLPAAVSGVNATGLNYFSGTLSDGSGTLAFTKTGSGTQILASAQSYSGATTINAGTLQLGIANALPSGAGKGDVTIVGNNTGTNVGAVTTNGSNRVLAPGTLDMGGFNQGINGLNSTTGGFVTNNPTLAWNGTAWAVAAGVQGAKTLTLGNNNASGAFNGVIQDGFSVEPGLNATGYVGGINLVKVGTGAQTLSGANTYGGTTAIQNGSIILTGGTNRLPTTTAVTLGSGSDSGVLQVGGATTVTQTIAGLATSGAGTANKVVGGNASNSTLILNQTGSATYAGAIGGAGANENNLNFTLQGGGTLTTTGANTITGTTTVQGGSTLVLGSNITGTGTAALAVGGVGGGTLTGTGFSVSAATTVNAGGIIAPGATAATADIGTLTFSNGLTMNGGSLAFVIGSTGGSTPLLGDLINVTGGGFNVTSGSISLADLGGGNSVILGTYDLLNYSGTTFTGFGSLTLTNSVIGPNNYVATLFNDTVNNKLQVILDNARFWAGQTNGVWDTNTTANWNPGNFFLATDKVIFADLAPTVAPGTTNVVLNSMVTPGAVTFTNASLNYNLSGTGDITGTTGLSKSGAGAVVISLANTFSGNTSITGGSVEMQNAAAIGNNTGSISVSGTGELRLSNNIAVGAKALSLNGTGASSTGALRNLSGNNSYAGAITLVGASRINSDAGTLTLSGGVTNGANNLVLGGAGNVTVSGVIGSGSGTLTVDGTGVVTLSNTNTYTGQTFIQNGTLCVNTIGSYNGGTPVAGGLGAPTTVGDSTIAIGSGANTGTLRWTGSSNESTDRVIDLAGTTGGAVIDASGTGGSVLTLSSALTFTGAGSKTLTFTGTGGTTGTPNVISNGIVDPSGFATSLLKTGSGVWRLDGTSNYTGSTTINGGTLLMGAANGLPTTAPTIANGSTSATLSLGGNSQTFNGITFGGASATSSAQGTLAIGATGTLTLSGDVTYTATGNPLGASITSSGTATLDLNAAARNFTVGSSTGSGGSDLTISAVIADAATGGSLVKTGAGTLVLTGTNTYAGATTVNGGILSANPAALGTTGTINVGTTTSAELNLYADNSASGVTLASNTNLNVGGASSVGTLGFQLNGASAADTLTLAGTGALTVGAGGGVVNARTLGTLTGTSYTLIDNTNIAPVTITGFTLGTLTGGYAYSLDNTTAGQLKLTVGAANAGPYYWNGSLGSGGNGSWATLASNGASTNWRLNANGTGEAGATPGGVDVHFVTDTAANVNTTLDQPYSISGLIFNNNTSGTGNVTISSGAGGAASTLTLGANGITINTSATSTSTTIAAPVILGANQSWGVTDAGHSLTVSGAVSGSSNLTKTGLGTLVLSGANTGFSGAVAINGGTVSIGASNNLGDASATNTLSIAGGTLRNTGASVILGTNRTVALGAGGGTFDVTSSNNLTVDGTVSGTTILTKTSAGTLVLTGANTGFSGPVAINGGTLSIGASNNLGDASATNTLSIASGTLQNTGASVTLGTNRIVALGVGGGTIDVTSSNSLTVDGLLSGSTGLTKTNTGILVLGGANTGFSGAVTLNGGTVRISAANNLGDGTATNSVTINNATLNGTATLSDSRGYTIGHASSMLAANTGTTYTIANTASTNVGGSGTLNLNGPGIVVLDDILNANTFSGGSILSGLGTVRINTATSLGAQTGAVTLKDAILQATESITTTRDVTLASYGAIVSVDGTKTLSVSGLLSDGTPAGTLNKTGVGILDLTRAAGNTYTGGTFVQGGTLLVSNTSGSATGTGAVSVGVGRFVNGTQTTTSTGTLGGAGIISGAVRLYSGATLSPATGTTAGTLTVGGLQLDAGSLLSYQLGAIASSDKTVVTTSGGFTANGGQFTLTGLSGLTNGTYNLITYTGALGGSFSNLSLASPYVADSTNTYYASLVNNTGSVDLTTTNSMVWNGNQSGTIWQHGNSPATNNNWKTGAVINLDFFNTMAATFDDTATGYTANITGTVTPSSITVNAANDYTFANGGSGVISGTTGITKSNTGGLTIDTNNTFSGNTTLSGGFIQMNNAGALGTTGNISIAAGTSLILNDATGVNLASRITSISGGGHDGNGVVQNFQGSSTISNALALTAATRFGATGGTLTLAGNLSGTDRAVTLAASGTGNIALTGASVSIGNANFTATNTGSGTITVANTLAVGTSAVVLNGTGTTTLNGAITSSSTGNGLVISNSGTNNINANVSVTGVGGDISIGGSATTTFGASSVTSWNDSAAISSSGNTTFNGTISGSGKLTKTGAGTLTFTAPNPSFSGAVTQSALNVGVDVGLIVATASNALGTGPVTLIYDTTLGSPTKLQLQLSGGITLGNNFTTTGAGRDGTTSGLIRTLTGANTLSGGLTLQSGGGATTLRADTGSSLALNGAITANTTGRYVWLLGGGDFSFGAAGSINDTSTTGTVGFRSHNSGTTTIGSVANTYTLITEIGNGNILTIAALADGGTNSSIGAAAATATNLVLDNGTLRYVGSTAQSTNRLFSVGALGATIDASGTGSGSMSFTGTGSLGFIGISPVGGSASISTAPRTLVLTGTNAENNTLAPVISDNTGATSLTKSGTGKWVLTGNNTYTGLTSVSNGVLNVQHANALGSAATGATTVASGATLQIQVSGIGAEVTTINGSGFTGQTGALVNVSGTSAYGGLLTLGSSATIASDAGTLNLTNAGSITGAGFNLTITGAGDGNISASLDTVGGSLTKSGNGAWALLASSSYAGDTTLTLGALRAGSNASFGTSALKLNGGTLTSDGATARAFANNVTIGGDVALGAASTYTGALTFNGTVGLGAAARTLTINSDVIFAGVVSDGSLTKLGTGTLILTGANTYTGGTTISAGTLQLGNGGTTGSVAAGDIANAGTFAISRSDDLTFASKITGAGAFTKLGAGNLTLSGANTFGGGTTISAGTLSLGNVNALGTGAVNVASGATLNLNNSSISNTITLATGATLANGSLPVSTAPTTGVLDVVLTGTAPLEKTDSGTLVLMGANTFTAPTNVTAGKIAVADFGNGTDASPLGITDLADPSKLVLAGASGVIPVLEFTGVGGASTARSFTVGGDGAGIEAKAGAGALRFNSTAKINLAAANAKFMLAAYNTAVNRFEAELASGSHSLKNVTIDGTGQWVIAGPANRFVGDFRLDVAGGTLKFESGALGTNSSHLGSVINVFDGATLAWAANNTNDIAERISIPVGAKAKLHTEGLTPVVLNKAPNMGAGASLEKVGNGTLTLGANFDASTRVVSLTSGRLVVNGTVGDVTVASGAVLSGIGTVVNVKVGSGGTLAPGTSPGLMTSTSSQLSGGSIYDFEVSNATAPAGTGYDSFITGTLDLSGAGTAAGQKITIKVISMATSEAGTIPANFSKDDIRSFTFGTYSGNILLPSGITNINDIFAIDVSQFLYSEGTTSNAALWSLNFDNLSNGTLTLTAVPEPSTYGFGLGALALAAAAVRRRRKQAQAKA